MVRWLEEVNRNAQMSFEEFVFHECADFCDRFPGGQIRKWCLDKDGSKLVSNVINYEKLHSDWPSLCETLGVPVSNLPLSNPTVMEDGSFRTEHNYTKEYGSEMVNRVREAFSMDIEAFNFTFGG